MGAKIVAIEYVFPDRKVTNADLAIEFPNYDFSQFESKVGINTRYVVEENETAFDLAVKVCEKLFEQVDRTEIDYILYCTQSPDYFLPTTACILQNKLKLRRDVAAFDYNLGCSGYPYGISLAKGIINSKQAKNVLLVTAETYSKYLHPQDRSNRAIFGDAATATLITYDDREFIGEFSFGTDGGGYDKLIIRNGASRNPFDKSAAVIEYGTGNLYTDNHLFMDGPEVFNFTSSVIPSFTHKILAKNNLQIENIDQFVLHQANAFMLDFIRKRLKIDKDNFFIDLWDGGNTVSCTIPIALKKYITNSKSNNHKIAIVGFGVGLSWCGGVLEINKL